MLLVKFIFLSMGLIAVTSCALAQTNQAPNLSAATLRVINQGSTSGIQTEHFEVIRDNESLLKLWQLHTGSITQSNSKTHQIETHQLESPQLAVLNPELPQIAAPTSTLPTLDFNKEMLIAAFTGNKTTGGYLISVTQVSLLDDSIEVNLVLIKPSNNCLVTSSITQPYTMVAAQPISDKPAHFNLQIKSKNCDTGLIE